MTRRRQTMMDMLPLIGICLLALGVLCLGIGTVCSKSRSQSDAAGRKACSYRVAKRLRQSLEQWRDEDKAALEAQSGRRQERLAWLVCKMEYALSCSDSSEKLKKAEVRLLVEDTVALMERARAQWQAGEEELAEESGARLRAYRSAIDGSWQTYSVSIPPDYDPSVAWPLIVSLHGHGWFQPFQGHPAPSFRGAICLSPQGRGAQDYRELGEEDVLAAIACVQRDFHVDADRIYLTGVSMGGTGSFYLGVHYADRFAAIFPIVGNADSKAWMARWGWNQDFPGRNKALREMVQEGQTARAFAMNLFNLPTYILSGGGDTVVPPEHSRQMADELRRNHVTVEYHEDPNGGHGGFEQAVVQAGLTWMCGWKRNPYPSEIHWKASQMKHGRSYWLRMEQLLAAPAAGEIHAVVESPTRLVVTTSNVREFSFQRVAALFSGEKPLSIRVDDVELWLASKANRDEWIGLRKDPNHGWRLAEDLPMESFMKKACCEGPIQQVFLSPFVIVVGTQNPGMVEAWKAEAEHFVAEWRRRNGCVPRVVMDVDVDEEMERSNNLVLLGGAEDNAVSSRQVSRIPWSDLQSLLVSRDYETSETSLKSFEEAGEGSSLLSHPDVGMFIGYPNEAEPEHLVALWTANSKAAAYQGWWRFGNWFNWGVYDSMKYFDYGVYDGRSCNPESMLLVGWFGPDWQVSTGRYYLANDAVRKSSAEQVYPVYDQGVPAVSSLGLSEVRPRRIDQMRGAVGFGRTFFGEPLPGGIGVRAPAVLEYEINGMYQVFSTAVELQNPRESRMCPMRERGESVRFRVLGDGKALSECTLDWRQPKGALSVDVTGVQVLTLETQAVRGPAWLHMGAGWLNPRLETRTK